MIKVIFLDVDNTLLSFSGYVQQTMAEGFRKFGLKPYTEDMFPVFEKINNALWQQIERGEITFAELQQIRWNRVFAALGIDFDGVLFEEYFRQQLFCSAVPEDGAYLLLEYLQGKYTLCVASNGPYEQQMNRLNIGKMAAYFDYFFISEKLGCQKPSRGFFDRCFEELRAGGFPDLQPEETLIIGDSMSSDMAGGIEYGIHTVLYSKKPVGTEDASRVERVISDLRQVRDFL